ncbi:Type II and III secretion system protein [Georgfuchsia toluolica]|uniref:Type II and III secretion system protein n=1 Tax=Georgfuchsia toluolica TaxID=424218 RepID=A0A916N0T1_9PROT|nr:secretin N-terminal domain-containing protein [Georgfuchsia toluolica]CAG4884243.1 Type II and III secretion system protein [Georgfuchsia toluolica]
MLGHNQKITLLASLLLAACNHAPVQAPASGHLQQSDVVASSAAAAIPPPVQSSVALPRPKPAPKVETYSVVVQNLPAQDLLFALARDAKLNVDVHPGINGTVTLNAINQTLQQLLTRISKQVDMRWELDGPNLIVTPDTPYLRTYTVDYVNMTRDTSVSTSVNSQVSSGTTTGSGSGSGSGSSGNSSTTKIDNTSKNRFWETLEKNLNDILGEEDKYLWEVSCKASAEGKKSSSGQASGSASLKSEPSRTDVQANVGADSNDSVASSKQNACGHLKEAKLVIVNPETGMVAARASSRQHEKIIEFLDSVMNSARRQVMIEATIVQVDLNEGYQQGIDWSRLRSDGSGFSLSLPTLSSGQSSITPFTLSRTDNSSPLNLTQTVNLLSNFGTIKVLSSPKLSVLNNQTAVLKVVNNIIYFTIVSNVAAGNSGAAQTATTATPQTVSVGLVMSVTPQVASDRSIILNVRPSISAISGFVTDPSPGLAVPNQVPQIQTSEIESIMRLNDGDIAVLGGLMQERGDYETGKVPGAGDIPFWGEIFTKRNNATTKSELVVFLRPVVVENPSMIGDYRTLKKYLPGRNFNAPPVHSKQFEPPFGIDPQEASH